MGRERDLECSSCGSRNYAFRCFCNSVSSLVSLLTTKLLMIPSGFLVLAIGSAPEINRLQRLTLAMSTAYHPQTDGQSDSLNKCLEQYLCCYVADAPIKWVTMLPWAEFWYNTSYQTFAGMTPFQALYGREPPIAARYILGSPASDLVEAYLIQRDAVLDLSKANLIKAQTRMKKFVDKHRTELVFAVGDWVFVKLKPYRQLSMQLQKGHKLGRRYFGPFKVIKRIGEVAYKLELPVEAKIHPVFHVSVLKRCLHEPIQQVTPLQVQDCPDQTEIDDFNLEDKVDFQEGSNVVNSVDTSANLDDKEDATSDDFRIGKPCWSTRSVIPPKRLDNYFWAGRKSREQGKS